MQAHELEVVLIFLFWAVLQVRQFVAEDKQEAQVIEHDKQTVGVFKEVS
jgi:hypothetical protein